MKLYLSVRLVSVDRITNYPKSGTGAEYWFLPTGKHKMLFQRSAMLLGRVFITFLFCIDATFTENIEITRKIPRDNKNRLKWKEGYDSFFIPI